MQKDYAHRSRSSHVSRGWNIPLVSRKKTRRTFPWRGLFLLLFILMIAVAGVYYLKKFSSPTIKIFKEKAPAPTIVKLEKQIVTAPVVRTLPDENKNIIIAPVQPIRSENKTPFTNPIPTPNMAPQQKITPPPPRTNLTAATQEIPAQEISPENKVKFDFYTMLPKMKVEVAKDNSKNGTLVATTPKKYSTVTPIKTQTNIATVENALFIVQLASFPNVADATTYQDKLKDLGFKPQLVTTERGNTTWYRVQFGPFSNEQDAQGLHQKLDENNIESVVVKTP